MLILLDGWPLGTLDPSHRHSSQGWHSSKLFSDIFGSEHFSKKTEVNRGLGDCRFYTRRAGVVFGTVG